VDAEETEGVMIITVSLECEGEDTEGEVVVTWVETWVVVILTGLLQ